MKAIKILTLSVFALFCAAFASAQTADEIIVKYIDAIGGKDQISKINSIYMEGLLDVMGSQGSVKTTILNGKGYKQVIDVMGSLVTMCYTDNMGWQINPMAGNPNAEVMPPGQYNSGKDQIYIGGPLTDYSSRGYVIEYLGQELIGDVNTYKVKVVTPDKISALYYFDPATGYLIRIVQQGEMMGQTMDITLNFSNYQKTDAGYAMPYKTETNYGGQFALVATFSKVELNKEIDPAIFVKP
jgi:hypothetical protein